MWIADLYKLESTMYVINGLNGSIGGTTFMPSPEQSVLSLLGFNSAQIYPILQMDSPKFRTYDQFCSC